MMRLISARAQDDGEQTAKKAKKGTGKGKKKFEASESEEEDKRSSWEIEGDREAEEYMRK